MTDKPIEEPKKEKYVIPELQCTVSTYELLDNEKMEVIISHTFHGSTQKEIFALIEAHKKDDSFFRASFEGEFPYNGGVIYLKNSEIKIVFP